MNTERVHDQLIYEAAARWHVVMERDPSAAERESFDRWLLESQRHIRSYLRVVALDRELRKMDPKKQLAIEPIDAGAADGAVVSLKRRLPTSLEPVRAEKKPMSLRWAIAACVAIVAGLFAAAILKPWSVSDPYVTTVGEQRIIKLADGSVMYLNTRSRARVGFDAGTRQIELLDGEASFVVAKDSTRPFRVTAGKTVVQAIGTEFNVYRRADETAVSVVEGRVQVLANEQPVRLDAGEEADVRNDGKVTKRKSFSGGSATAWRERRLVFRESTLDEIVVEFNRYNESPQLRVEGDVAASRRYSGIFDAYDPGSLAQLLSTDEALRVDRSAREIVVRER